MTETHLDEIVPESDETALYACGHKGFIKYSFFYLGFQFGTDPRMIEKLDLCPMCTWKRMRPQIILCARCGLPILPGNQVKKVKVGGPQHQHAFEAGEGEYLACSRCVNIAFTGFWTGERYRPLEVVSAARDGVQIFR